MANNIEVHVTENENEWVNWIEEAIDKEYLKYYEYKEFSNFQEIGSGGFGRVYRANWKNSEKSFALKTFFNINNVTVKEIVRELKIHRDVDFHDNIIRFHGITKFKSAGYHVDKNYMLVMEYANSGSLRNYLKKSFGKLTWDNKYNMAYQLACAVSCLHKEGIVHHDLHSGNILVHQNMIKLADFGLSRRIETSSNVQSNFFGMIPYVDPKLLIRQKNNNNQRNEKSDIYSVGVLLWEISSGWPPFRDEQYDFSLALKISQGFRETIVPDTPENYAKIYTKCWNDEPDNRPTIYQVVEWLKTMITITDVTEENLQPSDKLEFNKVSVDTYSKSLIHNFNNMNTEDIESITPSTTSSDNKINSINLTYEQKTWNNTNAINNDDNNSSNSSLKSYSSANHSTNNGLSESITTDIRLRSSKNMLLRSLLKEHKKSQEYNLFK